MIPLQRQRLLFRFAFFGLFLIAPIFDLFRLDLNLGHFIFLGMDWTLGIDPFLEGRAGIGNAFINLLFRGFLPIVLIGGGLLWVAWKYGRLYCGWLCPHFSMVELINGMMLQASGKPTLWEPRPLPAQRPDGRLLRPSAWLWIPTLVVALAVSFVWAVVLLTYLLPPAEIYGNLWQGELTRNQALFVSIATAVFMIDFTLARHLFCRYGCAVGLFQSLVWMANKKAMVVGFEAARARSCADCNAACDNVCPMRLKPRSIKRKMFTCTQCAQCIDACEQVQQDNPQGSLLHWVREEEALAVSDREAARKNRCLNGSGPVCKSFGEG